ncbi:protein MANBAL [Ornithorhynchus anatinus]|uniref:protein MANBAL n=1 Tax=Ornithorhynchus anatinus TaxID=9258 RepID=UPI0010A8CFB9|nr:protein MANBAL [Ornithorhynchus anatinus]
MASELGFSPPEVPEPTFLEHVLRYGLFLGAVFQLVCILAIVFPAAKPHQPEPEPPEARGPESARKPKTSGPPLGKKLKKETKKKR